MSLRLPASSYQTLGVEMGVESGAVSVFCRKPEGFHEGMFLEVRVGSGELTSCALQILVEDKL